LHYKNQVFSVLLLSLIVSVSFNFLREGGISYVKKPLKTVQDQYNISEPLSEPSISLIDIDLAKIFHRDSTLFVDARGPEYLFEGYIPGAIANDNVDSLAEKISTKIGFNEKFVIYCSDDDCGSSEDLAYELQSFGFKNIFVFKGGWKSWVEAGLSVSYYE
tara:strand:+ start:348 stop:830 length:483 start_codon:yes stop_codon:yes gene_type:complete